MAIREHQDISGRLTLHLRAADGRVVEERAARNTITIGGRQLLARLFNSQMPENIPRVSHMGLGSDGTAVKAEDAGLRRLVGAVPIKEIVEAQATVDGQPRTLLRIVGELNEGDCNGELREAGLFAGEPEAGGGKRSKAKDQTGPLMYNRVTFAPITKSEEFKLTLVWEITF